MADIPPRVVSERYEISKHIARGGMAQVYLARDLLLDRPVALKVLFPELSVDQSFVERFRREAKAAANLSHPNIVSVYDWGQGDGTYYIVLEYVDGPPLSVLLKDGPFTPERAAEVAGYVAEALDFAHRRGVIHRDVKPGNVLIDSRGRVKVADFGIARAAGTSDNLTQTGSVMGTATYFSPEQAQGYPVDSRSDVYSLGVVLYEMVTGRPPFSGDNPVAIAYQHVKEEPPAPSSVHPSVPAALEAIILKCLAKDPAARYPTAEDLGADLARFTSGQPVMAAAGLAAAATGVLGTVGGAPTTVSSSVTSVLPPAGYRPGPPLPPRPLPPVERSRGPIYALAALLLALLLVGAYFGGRSLGLWGTKTLTVPSDLRGQPVSNAQAELSTLGFTNVKTAGRTDPTVHAGDVIGTSPPGGSRIKSDAALTLLVSTGAVQVAVPDVHGLPYAQAASALTAKGFRPVQVNQNSTTVTSGMVISTNPPAGAQADSGATVQVLVSSGAQTVPVPEVVNQPPSVAGQMLAAAQLKVARQVGEPSSTVTIGNVTRTDPPAGTPVQVGTPVTVYVSTGITMPDVRGEDQATAQATLSADNLAANFTAAPVTDPTSNGKVIAQSPAPGTTGLSPGSAVQITIGQYSAASTTAPSTTVASSTTSSPPPTT